MTIFVIIDQSEPEALLPSTLGDAIDAKYPGANFPIASNVWLVVDHGRTAKEVCDNLGIIHGEELRAVVVSVENYFGVASKDIWEWMKVKEERR